MSFSFHNQALHADSIPLATLAEQYGTPLYIYSASRIRENYSRFAAAFAPLNPGIKYTLKANASLAILRLLKDLGAGFDVVSGGDIYRTLRTGADPAQLVFTGIGKTDAELAYALSAGVAWFNVETLEELVALDRRAAAGGRKAAVALRLNPGVRVDTHPHIRTGAPEDKFGFPAEEACALLDRAGEFPHLNFRGLHLHIGSQIPHPDDTLRALEVALGLVERFPGLELLDIGGGYPIPYSPEDNYPSIEDFAAPIVERLRQPPASRLRIHLEPGRYVVADAGALVLTVLADKRAGGRRVVIVDGGMNVLIRPALYGAFHAVLPLRETKDYSPRSGAKWGGGRQLPWCGSGIGGRQAAVGGREEILRSAQNDSWQAADVAGPICESADYLAHDVPLPGNLKRGDRLAVLNAGAYGMVMASNYNGHPLPAEVLVDGETHRLIRRRQTYEDLIAGEEML